MPRRSALRPTLPDMKAVLDEAYERFATPDFIADDPIQVPRSFSERGNAEVIGFLTATIAWGQRRTIIANAHKLVRLMDHAPHDFVLHASPAELRTLEHFVHRTFNGTDLRYFIRALRQLYVEFGDLESAFLGEHEGDGAWHAGTAIHRFKQRFFGLRHPARTTKHVADPAKGSNAKRLNMYLRWMVRPADRGVDLGLWTRIRPADLMVPLDVHTGRVGRAFGLLLRSQDDWRAVEELTEALRHFDPKDPVKYDIALFGLGVEAGKG